MKFLWFNNTSHYIKCTHNTMVVYCTCNAEVVSSSLTECSIMLYTKRAGYLNRQRYEGDGPL